MSDFTDKLRLELQVPGENEDTWGDKLNKVIELIDDAIAGQVQIALASADYTLDTAFSETDEARNMALNLTGTLSDNVAVIVPAKTKLYLVKNNTQGDFDVTVKTAAGVGVKVRQGAKDLVFADANGVHIVSTDELQGDIFSPVDVGLDFGGSELTLNEVQAAKRIVRLTGVMTQDMTVILPDDRGVRWFINETTGGFKVSVKTVSGDPIPLQVDTTVIITDGAQAYEPFSWFAGVLEVDAAGSDNIDLRGVSHRIIHLTGLRTDDGTIIVDDRQDSYMVVDDTTGGYVLSAKTDTGSKTIKVRLRNTELRSDGAEISEPDAEGPVVLNVDASGGDDIDLTGVVDFQVRLHGTITDDITLIFNDRRSIYHVWNETSGDFKVMARTESMDQANAITVQYKNTTVRVNDGSVYETRQVLSGVISDLSLESAFVHPVLVNTTSLPGNRWLTGIQMSDGNIAGIIATGSGDNGVVWGESTGIKMDRVTSTGSGYAVDVMETSQGTIIFIGSNGRIGRSIDNGLNYTTISTPTSTDILAIRETEQGTLIAALGGSACLRSTDDGLNWDLINTPGSSSNELIVAKTASGAEVVIITNPAGQEVFRSTDDGQTWTGVTMPGSESGPYSLTHLGGDVFVGGMGDNMNIVRSQDGGVSFATINLVNDDGRPGIISYGEGIAVAYVTTFSGVSNTGRIFRTEDYGETWSLTQELGVPASSRFNEVLNTKPFIKTPQGVLFAVFDGGYVFYSSDKGKTFHMIDLGLGDFESTSPLYLENGTIIIGASDGDSLDQRRYAVVNQPVSVNQVESKMDW